MSSEAESTTPTVQQPEAEATAPQAAPLDQPPLVDAEHKDGSDEKTEVDSPAPAVAAPAGLPKKMRAVYLTKYINDTKSDDLKDHFEVREVDMPVPKSGEVLVKMECSPINPSDLGTLQGTYNAAQREELPCQLGFEGSGTVVQTGGGLLAWMVKGKRVGVASKKGGRFWAEYAVVPAMQCLPLPDNVTFEQGCSCFVNPLTAIAFVQIAKARGLSTILHTAAASALGKMLVKYAKSQQINIICVVRKEEQAKSLADIGAHLIVNTSSENWTEQLKKMCAENKCTLGFDAVAGQLTGQVLHCMPKGSELQVYGGLSNEGAGSIHPSDLIFQQKKVTGFWLTSYLAQKYLMQLKMMTNEVAANLSTSLGSDITQTFPLHEVANAISSYTKNMSAGKVAIAPWKQ